MKEVQYLVDWFSRYLRNRDIYFKKIKDIQQKGNQILVQEKERFVTYYVLGFGDDIQNLVASFKEGEYYGLIFYNTEANFTQLVNHWPNLITHRHLIVYFVNPFSKLEKKWMVHPQTHDRISDTSSLKSGLRTMFEMVETTSLEEVKKIIE